MKMKKIGTYLDHILPVGPFSAAHPTSYESNACLENLASTKVEIL